MLYTVLDLLKTTVTLGLWKSIDQFRELIPLLIMRISKIDSEKLFTPDKSPSGRMPRDIVEINKE